MRQFLFILAVTLCFTLNVHTQELNIVDGKYTSVFYVQTDSLSFDQIISALETNHYKDKNPVVKYKNKGAEMFLIEYGFNWRKDPVGRWWNVIMPCRCTLSGNTIKVTMEDFKLEYYKTNEKDSDIGRTVFESGKGHLSDESKASLLVGVQFVKKDIEEILKKSAEYW